MTPQVGPISVFWYRCCRSGRLAGTSSAARPRPVGLVDRRLLPGGRGGRGRCLPGPRDGLANERRGAGAPPMLAPADHRAGRRPASGRVAAVETGFLRGTAGPNRFGPDPLGGQGAPQWQPGAPPQGWQPQAPAAGLAAAAMAAAAATGLAAAAAGLAAAGAGAPPPGYGQPPPGYGAAAARVWAAAAGYGQPPPGYGQPPPRRAVDRARARAAACRRCGATDASAGSTGEGGVPAASITAPACSSRSSR